MKIRTFLDWLFLVTRGAPQRNQGRQGKEGVDIVMQTHTLIHTDTYINLHETEKQL